jgi:LmbE family N-acetylglucosaminyl deacetylase
MNTSVVFCAHPDDEVLGVGGTIAKYRNEGANVVTVIFSSGERSHPWMKKNVTVVAREKETEKVAKMLGINRAINLGLKDGTIWKESKEKQTYEKIMSIIKEYNPDKIFTHAVDDPHPDHHAVYKIVREVMNMINFKGNIYSYEIWNPFNVMKRKLPKMYVDISDTFKIKKNALKCFESQKLFIVPLLPVTYLRAIFAGLQAHCKYAEAFYIVK